MRKHLSLFVGLGLAVTSFGCDDGAVDDATAVETQQSAIQDSELAPTGKGIGTMNKFQNPSGNAGKPSSGSNGIVYHGGPVMLGTVNVYYIWYGNWAGNTRHDDPHRSRQQHRRLALLQHQHDLLQRRRACTCRTRSPTAAATDDTYSHGTSLTDAAIQDGRRDADHQRRAAQRHERRLLRADLGRRHGVERLLHPVLRLAHARARSRACDIKYAFVGNPDRCPSSCAAQTTARTATPAPTAWPRSSRTSWKRRRPIPT